MKRFSINIVCYLKIVVQLPRVEFHLKRVKTILNNEAMENKSYAEFKALHS